MANPLLFKSSLICGGIHVLLVIGWGAPFLLSLCYTIGVITSIWNHGTTSELAKWSDRVFIAIAVIVDIVYMFFLPLISLFIAISTISFSVVLFLMAKKEIKNGKSGNPFHLGSHVVATILHSILILSESIGDIGDFIRLDPYSMFF